MTGLLIVLVMLGLAALLGGYGGALHPAGDSLAVFRPTLAIAVLLLALPLLIGGPRGFGLLAIALAGAALAEPAWLRLTAPPDGEVTVYQKNLRHRSDDAPSVVWDVEAARPDAVFLQEVTETNEAVLDLLATRYPAQVRCPYLAIGDTAVLSRWPAIEGTARCADGAAILRVEAPGGPLWLVSVHLRWPWPHRGPAQAEALAALLAELDGPMVIGGDLNMVPWAHAVRRLGEATGTRPVRPAPATFRLAGVLPLPIDHVLTTGRAGRAQQRRLLGSDHHGVLARVSPFEGAQPPMSAASNG